MARILICDDAVFMRAVLSEALRNAGHEIVGEAEDADTVVELYKKVKPDLVTMDILMKNSGVDAIKKIIDFDPKARIIVVSVLTAQEAEVVEAIRSGASGIVGKPINRSVLLSEVTRVLKSA